uniref:Uncharacterized protein n=1 Tax=Glossina palpalis gambiensis TaxID=67801 RepID=A0A1B0BWV9_9MUSC
MQFYLYKSRVGFLPTFQFIARYKGRDASLLNQKRRAEEGLYFMQKTKQDLKRLKQHLIALELLQRKLQKEVNDTKEAVKDLSAANDKAMKMKEKEEERKKEDLNNKETEE